MASSKVFCGGLSWSTTDDSLRARFEEYGRVISASVILDRETGRSKGFGFVEFEEPKDAESAVEGMKDQDLDGRTIRVDLASGTRREGGGGGFRGGRGGGRDYGSGRDFGGDRGGDRGPRRDYGDRERSSGGGRRDYDSGSRGGGERRSYGGDDRRSASKPYDRPPRD
ncbi:hypothetical protein BC831DRAFT_454235 [Entophlyctis helioformis]|nr:hypothetical protein BC831DRAFT_465017 [Entophlyctis helioformis]KAI8927026.1 hypothetical protein BC831DRAFT_454235 [Entophlyctis helioformis]